ncbi:MAG: extracellular solute-binding protein [Clostridia bacterium]|nr:extracellular solute-binding protein [Clostridia bacterium]
MKKLFTLFAVAILAVSIFILPAYGGELRADLNGDGKVDSDDAVYLLYHVYFPEQYPVHEIADPDHECGTPAPGGKVCVTCGQSLPAEHEHTVVTDPAVTPSCTEDGVSEGKHCSVCGEVITAQITVPATGHKEVIVPAVAPTYTNTGLTEGKKCSFCGITIVSQTTIPVLRYPDGEPTEYPNYGGNQTVTILARGEYNDYTANEICVNELTNDPINDSIYNRNASICNILGLKEIVQISVDDPTVLQQRVNLMVNSGDQTYDIVAASAAYGTPMINQGYMYNLYDNGIDTYLDPAKPWWSQYWIEQAEIGNKLYCITGAPSLSLTKLMSVIYYNKDLAENYSAIYPELADIYTIVDNGDWTFDKFVELGGDFYGDMNGDTTFDAEDLYGIVINSYENCDMFWSAFDMTMLSKDNEGWFEFDSSNKEKIANAFEKVYQLIHEKKGSYNTGGAEDFDNACNMFASGRVLFATLHLSHSESLPLRNMQSEYGIIPIPKYDKNQSNYYTYAHDEYTVFMIPKTVPDPVMSGVVLETMAYESYKTVQPAYYNMLLKGKYETDPQSKKMLDTITTNVKIDPATIYGRQLGLPEAAVFRDLIYNGEKSFDVAYSKQERMLPLILKEFKNTVSKFKF